MVREREQNCRLVSPKAESSRSGAAAPELTRHTHINFEADYTGKLTAWPTTSFTVDNLVGVYPLDLTGTGPSGWIYSITPVSGPSWNYPYFTSDVTWTYIGLPMLSSGNGTGSTDLGIFQITTQSNFAGGYPAVLPTSVDYSLSINGGPSTPGGSPVELIEGGITAAPEPSTLIAPLMVLLSLPVFRLLKRRIPRPGDSLIGRSLAIDRPFLVCLSGHFLTSARLDMKVWNWGRDSRALMSRWT